MAPAGVAVAALALALGAPARANDRAPCAGRYVVTRATGALVAGPGDVVVLDGTNAVLDPSCGVATTTTRVARGRWRIAARWPDCRGARLLRLRVRASADCTLLRGRATARGRKASRFVAVTSTCGDGVVDAGRGERCDDGNVLDGDACDAACGRCAGPATFASTWEAIQTRVFDGACTTCHGESVTAGLDLRGPGTYERIVGVVVPDAAGLFQVQPGVRAASFVWLKVAKAALGGRDDVPGPGMPIGLPLPAPTVEAIGRWIDAGAPRDGLVEGAEALLAACPG